MNICFIEHFLTNRDAEYIKDLSTYFKKVNAKLLQDYAIERDVLIFIFIMNENATGVKRILELYKKDLDKLTDKQLRKLLKLRKYKQECYSQLTLIQRAINFDNRREIEHFKQYHGDEFHIKFLGYSLAELQERLN